MADEKILKDELLSDEELDRVTGGFDSLRLYYALNGNPYLKKYIQYSSGCTQYIKEIIDALKGEELHFNVVNYWELGLTYYSRIEDGVKCRYSEDEVVSIIENYHP